MSKFNEFVPLKYTVEVQVSNNASAPAEPTFFEGEQELDPSVDLDVIE